jgi:hypothetical protein
MSKLWTGELYSEQFKASSSEYKDFQHALLHITKASGQLAALIEGLDHSGSLAPSRADAEKYLADLVICVLRMGNTFPGEPIDIERAIFNRIEKKMGVKLTPQV